MLTLMRELWITFRFNVDARRIERRSTIGNGEFYARICALRKGIDSRGIYGPHSGSAGKARNEARLAD
jgi:hypothetical protein